MYHFAVHFEISSIKDRRFSFAINIFQYSISHDQDQKEVLLRHENILKQQKLNTVDLIYRLNAQKYVLSVLSCRLKSSWSYQIRMQGQHSFGLIVYNSGALSL